MKKKLTLKKEVIVQLEKESMNQIMGGDSDLFCRSINACPSDLVLCSWMYCQSNDQGGARAAGSCNTCGGGARAAGSCGSCGQPTCDGQYSSVPYDCAPTDGGNSCNFPDGCHLDIPMKMTPIRRGKVTPQS